MPFHTFYLFPDNTSVTTATSPVYSNPIDQATCYQTQGILSVQWSRTGGDCTIDVLGCNDPTAFANPGASGLVWTTISTITVNANSGFTTIAQPAARIVRFKITRGASDTVITVKACWP